MQLADENVALKHRFATLTNGVPQLVWLSRDEGEWTWASPSWTAYTGLTAEASSGSNWYAAVHPDDQAATREAWRQATHGSVLDVEHRLLSPDQPGEARWFHTHGVPLPGIEGQEREWIGFATDVHEARLREQQRRRLLDALHHRVGNILSLTRSVARRTARTHCTVEDYVLHLDGRFDAVARTHAMMMANPDATVSLEHLVADGLRAHAAHEGEQVIMSGPEVLLQPKAVEWLSLAIHELAMNAVEHGALSVPHGRIAVTWHTEAVGAESVLRFGWLEAGVPVSDAALQRKGFGTELIECILRQELNATASLGPGPHGLCCTITMPITPDTAISAARLDD